MPIPTSLTGNNNEKTANEANTGDDFTSQAQTQSQDTIKTTGQTQQGKSEAELEADRLYEERIEEEYAKREGGA
jgi:hypothetical protein